jgi:NAD(P) transhydrogenase subunit alpha
MSAVTSLPTVLAAASTEGASPLVVNLAILVLAGLVGYAVISKVPNTLHTPLMSGTNAIHGIVVLGGLVLLATYPDLGVGTQIILFVALVFGVVNVIGGFVVTDRMLEMFKAKPKPKADTADEKKANV